MFKISFERREEQMKYEKKIVEKMEKENIDKIQMRSSDIFQDELLSNYVSHKFQGCKVEKVISLLPQLKQNYNNRQEELDALLN